MVNRSRLVCTIVGHAGHGKSSALGHLLHQDAGNLDQLELQAASDNERSAKFARVRAANESDTIYFRCTLPSPVLSARGVQCQLLSFT